ncbi:histidine protein methyltransferase 1 homolog [Protopterus annectens]|uniref:histidine protein methyltransferase 1 homolog n=1 Tax=Protopterus annectens TaxID=7888 RepID=UPI001CFB79A3|nr:histidine protein methyltransferase 1 homolog [Protopterus annectens]
MAFQFNFFFNEEVEETLQKVVQGKRSDDQPEIVPSTFYRDDNDDKIQASSFLSSEKTDVENGKTGVVSWSKNKQDIDEKSGGVLQSKIVVPVSFIKQKALAKEHSVPPDTTELFDNKIIETLHVGSTFSVYYIDVSLLEKEMLSEAVGEDVVAVSRAISTHSDLIPGVYEGGMKIWECTFDLITYLLENQVQFVGKKVLDLGCGAGLLGMAALKHHATEVHFQDYNATVIETLTIPNVLVNIEECCSGRENQNKTGTQQFTSHLEKNDKCQPQVENDYTDHHSTKRRKVAEVEQKNCQPRCRFFSGEWLSFLGLVMNTADLSDKYDIIITSETIYNVDNYPTLHDVLSHLLSEKGVVYVAGKTHYFGVGGGIHLFESFVQEKNIFSVRTAKVIDEGLKRIILALTFKTAC